MHGPYTKKKFLCLHYFLSQENPVILQPRINHAHSQVFSSEKVTNLSKSLHNILRWFWKEENAKEEFDSKCCEWQVVVRGIHPHKNYHGLHGKKEGGGGRHYWLGCSFRASVLDVPKRVLSLKWMKLHNNIVSLSASLR